MSRYVVKERKKNVVTEHLQKSRTEIVALTSTINKHREIIAHDRQGMQQQRPESPSNSTWRASKYKVYKLHQRYILKKGWPQWHIPSISGTLGESGVYRHTTESIFIRDRI